MTLVLTLVSVVVGIVELDVDADVACIVIRSPRKPYSENRDGSGVLPRWQCADGRCCDCNLADFALSYSRLCGLSKKRKNE